MVGWPQVAFAFSAGAATFFSPCSYPLLPGYLAYFLGANDAPRPPADRALAERVRRGVVVALATSAGFFLVYALLAGIAAAVGAQALSDVSLLEPVVGTLLVVLGLGMATGQTPTVHVRLPDRRRSVAGFFGFGVVYAAAAAGCTGPLFVGLAGVALASGPTGAVALFGAYALGMSLLMLGITLTAAVGGEALLRRFSAVSGRLSRVGGVVLVLAGLVQLSYFFFGFGGLSTLA